MIVFAIATVSLRDGTAGRRFDRTNGWVSAGPTACQVHRGAGATAVELTVPSPSGPGSCPGRCASPASAVEADAAGQLVVDGSRIGAEIVSDTGGEAAGHCGQGESEVLDTGAGLVPVAVGFAGRETAGR